MKFNQARLAVIGPLWAHDPASSSSSCVCVCELSMLWHQQQLRSDYYKHTHSTYCLFISGDGEYYHWAIKSVCSCMADVAHGVERAAVVTRKKLRVTWRSCATSSVDNETGFSLFKPLKIAPKFREGESISFYPFSQMEVQTRRHRTRSFTHYITLYLSVCQHNMWYNRRIYGGPESSNRHIQMGKHLHRAARSSQHDPNCSQGSQ